MTKIMFEIKHAAQTCGISEAMILTYVSHQWLVPANPVEVRLDEEDLARIRLILELQNNFGINAEGIGVVLHLIDQLYHLHSKVGQMDKK